MHDVISDVLANDSLPRNKKRSAIMEAARRYRDDTSFVTTEAGWREMSAMMGVQNMGGPSVGFLPAFPTPNGEGRSGGHEGQSRSCRRSLQTPHAAPKEAVGHLIDHAGSRCRREPNHARARQPKYSGIGGEMGLLIAGDVASGMPYDVRDRGSTLPHLARWTSWGGMLFVFSL